MTNTKKKKKEQINNVFGSVKLLEIRPINRLYLSQVFRDPNLIHQ